MDLVAEARAFGATYPTPRSHPYGGDDNWDQDCGSAMNRFIEWVGRASPSRGNIASAYWAAMGSGWLDPDPSTARIGDFHFYDIAGPANGHVQVQVDRNTLVFQGSNKSWEFVGRGLGFSSVADYLAKSPDATYLGHANNYSGARMDLSALATAGDTGTPIDNSTPIVIPEDTMIKLVNQKRGIAAIAPGYYFHCLEDADVYALDAMADKTLIVDEAQFDRTVRVALFGYGANTKADLDLQSRIADLAAKSTVSPALVD